MNRTVTDPNELTEDQTTMVVAAAKNQGRLQVCVRADTNGRAVRGKHKSYFDPNDRSVAQRYIEALSDLERFNLARQQGKRDEWELTNYGWLISRKLQPRT